MDTWLENDLAIAEADLAEISMNFRIVENVREEKPIFILRGWGKTRIKTLNQNKTNDSDQFLMKSTGPSRGFGRDGTFYRLFNIFLKSRKKVSQSYNYWRGAGKPVLKSI